MKADRPTSFDIAYRAGVSQSTVSRALRDSPQVSLETRRRVQAIARELNYKVDKNASNLRAQSTRTLALLIREDPTSDDSKINPFFLSLLGSITRATAERGYDLMVSFQQFSEDWHADYQDAHRADGLILLGYGDYVSYAEKLNKLAEEGGHFVIWGPVVPNQPGCSLGCDNEQGAYEATRHLIGLGRRRIVFLGGISAECPEFRQRYQGYVKAHREAGLAVDPRLQADAETLEDWGHRAVCELLDKDVAFDALFGASDLIAIGAINGLRERGLRVPQDVAVVGFDDIQSAAYVNPALTTVHQDTRLAGEKLVENLLQVIAGEQVASELLPTRLIVRDSCGASRL